MIQKYFLQIFIVGIGGFVGSIFRFVVGEISRRIIPLTQFPMGTLIVNIVGCFFIGLFGGLIEIKSIADSHLKLLLITGLLGGFTTFSAFGFDTYSLFRNDQIFKAIINVCVQVIVGLFAVVAGHYCSKLI